MIKKENRTEMYVNLGAVKTALTTETRLRKVCYRTWYTACWYWYTPVPIIVYVPCACCRQQKNKGKKKNRTENVNLSILEAALHGQVFIEWSKWDGKIKGL